MAGHSKDEERDERIAMEIMPDAYGEEEQMMSWYYYLEEHLRFPFTAKCVARRAVSPLKVGDEVKVVKMAPIKECDHEMLVMIKWKTHQWGVPLIQLEGVKVDEETQEAMEDWCYWVKGDEEEEEEE